MTPITDYLEEVRKRVQMSKALDEAFAVSEPQEDDSMGRWYLHDTQKLISLVDALLPMVEAVDKAKYDLLRYSSSDHADNCAQNEEDYVECNCWVQDFENAVDNIEQSLSTYHQKLSTLFPPKV